MIEVAKLNDVNTGEMIRVDIADRRLCLINIENTIYIIDDRCSHADFSLSEGTLDVDAKEVECPKHGALFDVTNGEARCLPATRPVQSYNPIVIDGVIYLEDGQINV